MDNDATNEGENREEQDLPLMSHIFVSWPNTECPTKSDPRHFSDWKDELLFWAASVKEDFCNSTDEKDKNEVSPSHYVSKEAWNSDMHV